MHKVHFDSELPQKSEPPHYRPREHVVQPVRATTRPRSALRLTREACCVCCALRESLPAPGACWRHARPRKSEPPDCPRAERFYAVHSPPGGPRGSPEAGEGVSGLTSACFDLSHPLRVAPWSIKNYAACKKTNPPDQTLHPRRRTGIY